jgi:hypothetical protein
MSTSHNIASPTTARAVRAWVESRTIWVQLDDGRTIGFPAEKYRLLKNAKDEDLAKVRIEARGRALRWEELDEDLSIDGILAGRWHP